MFKKRSRKIYFLVFVVPTLIAFMIGFIYPFFQGIYLSFCKFRTTSNATWVGFDNYIKAFQNESFIRSFWFTALFVVVSVILINAIAFFVAYALTLGIRGSNVFRTVFFMPNLIGGIILGYIWKLIFDGILQNFGTNIVLDANFGFWGLIILMCWQQAGYMMIIYIAGFQSVPSDLYEAAKIDGANKLQQIFAIKLPVIKPVLLTALSVRIIDAARTFDIIWAMTEGGPNSSSETISIIIYKTLTRYNDIGYASAMAVVFIVVLVVFTLVFMQSLWNPKKKNG